MAQGPTSTEGATMTRARFRRMIWPGLALAMGLPIVLAAFSPYLSFRSAIYIVAGFAGIVCLSLFLLQPLLGAGYLPGLTPAQQWQWHRRSGIAILICVVLHVGGLYLTSPPDVVDALLLASPTPFSVYGVIAMWGIVLTGAIFAFRRRLPLRPLTWRVLHNVLALAVVIATVVHALQIEGAMELVSKWVLSILVLSVTIWTMIDLRLLRSRRQRPIIRNPTS